MHSWPLALVVTFILLPVYMFHQYEENDNDRFRQFFNQTIGQGKDVLSPWVVFLTNVPGVWGVIGLSLFLSHCEHRICVDHRLPCVVNAIVHIAYAVIFRGYNSGLGTAIVLFRPLGSGLEEVQQAGGTVLMHVTGLLVAIGIHAAILAHVIRKRLKAGN